MPIMMNPMCPCCQALVWHCEDCWNKYHNGLKDKDFIPPEYPNQPMFESQPDEKTKVKK